MDPTKNPFAPGAGTPPPELAGRDEVIAEATIALGRLKAGKHARSQMLLGLRGVGKTVLLNRIMELAELQDFLTISMEAPEDQRLARLLVPKLRSLLLKLSTLERARSAAQKGMAILRSFAGAFKVTISQMEFGIAELPGIADSGNLEIDLPELLLSVAQAAQAAERPAAIFIDEVQYLNDEDLGALIVAIHQLGQRGLPLIMFGAGLPQLAGLAGEAKSYAERLFAYPTVGPLPEPAAREAIRAPIDREGAAITDAALTLMVEKTQGYPYFLQEWGSHTWNVAPSSPIGPEAVETATPRVLEQLDEGFFRVRMDRLTPRERDYVRAMAALGPGPHRSGAIASAMHMGVNQVAPLRDRLIKKGMIYSPQHGENAFTVPLFDDFMVRSMPDWTPPEGAARRRSREKK